MAEVIAYMRAPDPTINDLGGMSVVHPAKGVSTARALSKSVPGSASRTAVIDDSQLPAFRTFRNAWKIALGVVDHDMPKARAIRMAQIRKVRDAELEKKDVEVLRYITNPTELARIEAEKQPLRDIPANIQATVDAASTAEDLRNVWPAEIERRDSGRS